MVSVESESRGRIQSSQVSNHRQNIHVTAWGPLTISRAAQYNVAADPVARKIAASINITPAQLVLSWAVQRGTSVIPKSSQEDRLCSNLAGK